MGTALPRFQDDVWELYDTNTDWTQARDLADELPDKLAELQELFLEEARKYNVLPLDDRRVERLNPETAGRPSLIRGNSQLLFAGMGDGVVPPGRQLAGRPDAGAYQRLLDRRHGAGNARRITRVIAVATR